MSTTHNHPKPKIAPAPAPVAYQYMNATIVGVNAFGTAITYAKPGITNYDGRELFVHSTIQNGTLTVKIDDQPPSSYAASPIALPVAIDLSFLGIGAGTPSTAIPTSKGGPLTLTAAVTPSATPYQTDSGGVATTVTLTVIPTPQPAFVNTPVGYVVVKMDDGTGSFQLRWIGNAPQLANPPSTAAVIPNNPKTAGVAGPFGLETP